MPWQDSGKFPTVLVPLRKFAFLNKFANGLTTKPESQTCNKYKNTCQVDSAMDRCFALVGPKATPGFTGGQKIASSEK